MNGRVNVFELVRDVLDMGYGAALQGTDAQKDQAIRRALDGLSKSYGSLQTQSGPCYSSPACQFGYIFRYVTYNSNLLPPRLQALTELFKKDVLHIGCLGGGPGSDIVGVIKHLADLDKAPGVNFWLCDKERGWADWWGDVGMRTGALRLNTTFLEHDVLDSRTWKGSSRWLQSDLFTLVYFMSEVYSLRERATPYFDYVFSSAKRGAYFLYIDNNHSDFTDWFEALARKHALEVVLRDNGRQWMPSDEQKAALQKWIDRFDGLPRLQGDVAYRVAVK